MAALGERRRRREAERAAALAAEQAGSNVPLTRRELRRRQLEEQARLEAIATGELQLGPAGTYEVRKAAREAAATASESSAATSPDSGATASSPASAPSAASGAVPVERTSSPRSAGSATGSTPTGATATGAAPSTSPASAPSAATGAIATGRPPSRRSIRDKRETADDRETTPQERTATGLRPVVRTPSSAHGVRRLDATGQLTGVQPAVRPDDVPEHPLTGGIPAVGTRPSPPAAPRPTPATPVGRPTSASTGTSDPVEWDDAVTGVGEIIAVSPQSAQIDLSAARPSAVSAPEAAAGGVPTADAPDDTPDDDEDLDDEYDAAPLPRPQWVAISSVSGASADEAGQSTVSRRSLRAASAASAASTSSAPEAAEEHEDESAGRHPMVTVIKIVVLALVAAIIGALIWLLATEAFDDTPNATALTISTTDHPEETSAS